MAAGDLDAGKLIGVLAKAAGTAALAHADSRYLDLTKRFATSRVPWQEVESLEMPVRASFSKMELLVTDYNNPDGTKLATLWPSVEKALKALTLQLKASDQAAIKGSLIFDPVGNNLAIEHALKPLGWTGSVKIHRDYQFLGKGVDFEKQGVIAEAQFSNYPFLLNNVIRSFLFSKLGVALNGNSPEALLLITKAKVFPASNSTLY